MADLLTHVAVAYAVAAVAATVTDRADRWVPVVAVGAVAPDVIKPLVAVGAVWDTVAGVPYNVFGLHTLGGVILLAGLGASTLRPGDRRHGWLALTAGGVSHLLLDALVVRADRLTPPYLFPFTTRSLPAGNLYASADVWPALVAAPVAVAVFAWRSRR